MTSASVELSRALHAISASCTGLPLVGEHVSAAGSLAAVGIALPELLWRTRAERDACESSVIDVAKGALHTLWPGKRRQYLHKTVYYNDHGQKMDIWKRKDVTSGPVMLFVPGGAWVMGHRTPQGYALMSHLVEQGWVCLAIDYRVSPKHAWPAHFEDVIAAITWSRANVARYGGDPSFLAIAGASAGGHLASLAGLTGLPVDAVVSLYGRYDWADRSTPGRAMFVEFVERVIVQKRTGRRSILQQASPIRHVHPDAPPFMVIHGTSDALIPAWEARAFVDALCAVSESTVSYLELPGAQHAFDLFDHARTKPVVAKIGRFLNEILDHKRGIQAGGAA